MYPKNLLTEHEAWQMDSDLINDLQDSMESYFDSDEDEPEQEKKEDSVKVSERFKRNILKPFQDYTAKEQWVEDNNQAQGEGVSFFKREFRKAGAKGPSYAFYSIDTEADPEKGMFQIGEQATIISEIESEIVKINGVITDIDCESEDAVIFMISLFRQEDDSAIPQEGKIAKAVSQVQTSVRTRVIRNMERGKLESKYMYKDFEDFSVKGYEEAQSDLKDYLISKMADDCPPNQMQLEAIIKGILTEDVLLVLGPPGTGKTTVISYWVEYFIKKGQRVLISSQNNAAVDNVLARFGTIAETVRLGREEKVQENCQDYLPEKKIASMEKYFNDNHSRVIDDIKHNQNELENYKTRLQEYQDKLNELSKLSDDIKRQNEKVRSVLRNIANHYEVIKALEKDIDNIRWARAHKEIFLEVYETKSFLWRILNRRYAKRVKGDLLKSEADLNNKRKIYAETVNAYNTSVGFVKTEIEKINETDSAKNFFEKLHEVEENTQEAVQEAFLPDLKGESAALFRKPDFSSKPRENYSVIREQQNHVKNVIVSIKLAENALKSWNDLVNNNRNDIFQDALLETCQIVGATCIGINSNKKFANVKFDVAIVDESGQIQIHNALIPMTRARKNLLLGDYKQIPPCANDDVVAACKADDIDTKLLNMSFFEFLFESMRKKTIQQLEAEGRDKSELLRPVLSDYQRVPHKKFEPDVVEDMIERVTNDPKKLVNLNSQFRMPGNISDIISEWFYERNYHSSYNMENFEILVPGTDKPLVVISTSNAAGREESQPETKMGYHNHYEAKMIADIVEKAINLQPDGAREKFVNEIENKIGIISAYGAQVRLIREYLRKKKLGIGENQIRSMVASLDSFQGQERPLILYSLTRSTNYKKPDMGRVGFMKELRRLNVAFTRCKKQLVIIGDIDYLSECMNMEKVPEGENEWPCSGQQENQMISQEMIDQCAECPAVCERKFARFMRLLMQHVHDGAGDFIQSEDYLKKDA